VPGSLVETGSDIEAGGFRVLQGRFYVYVIRPLFGSLRYHLLVGA